MNLNRLFISIVSVSAASIIGGCGSSSTPPTPSGYVITPLVANATGYGTTRLDTTLVNPWGLTFDARNAMWIAQNGSATTAAYDTNGVRLKAVEAVRGLAGAPGSPTGIVANPNPSVPTSFKGDYYLYANEDGTISGFSYLGDTARAVVDRSTYGAIYKGLAIGNTNSTNYIYAANFKSGSIDIYDQALGTPRSVSDTSLPNGYAPFGIAMLNNSIYVTLAKQNGKDDAPGVGNGYVDVFNLDGTFKKRLVSQGTLNSPWGLAIAPNNFGDYSGALLVGNFGDGTINAYDANDGTAKGALKDASGNAIKIDGLWALVVNNNVLYYTAGPSHEANGVVGKITLK